MCFAPAQPRMWRTSSLHVTLLRQGATTLNLACDNFVFEGRQSNYLTVLLAQENLWISVT